eukprot:scaffold212019_cov22-Tisochrysis_lutea.AAC.1
MPGGFHNSTVRVLVRKRGVHRAAVYPVVLCVEALMRTMLCVCLAFWRISRLRPAPLNMLIPAPFQSQVEEATGLQSKPVTANHPHTVHHVDSGALHSA